jgi:hypothetical protein
MFCPPDSECVSAQTECLPVQAATSVLSFQAEAGRPRKARATWKLRTDMACHSPQAISLAIFRSVS